MRFYTAIHTKHWKQQKKLGGKPNGMKNEREEDEAHWRDKKAAPKHITSGPSTILPEAASESKPIVVFPSRASRYILYVYSPRLQCFKNHGKVSDIAI